MGGNDVIFSSCRCMLHWLEIGPCLLGWLIGWLVDLCSHAGYNQQVGVTSTTMTCTKHLSHHCVAFLS